MNTTRSDWVTIVAAEPTPLALEENNIDVQSMEKRLKVRSIQTWNRYFTLWLSVQEQL